MKRSLPKNRETFFLILKKNWHTYCVRYSYEYNVNFKWYSTYWYGQAAWKCVLVESIYWTSTLSSASSKCVAVYINVSFSGRCWFVASRGLCDITCGSDWLAGLSHGVAPTHWAFHGRESSFVHIQDPSRQPVNSIRGQPPFCISLWSSYSTRTM